MHPKVFSICHLYFSISLRAIYNSRQRNCEKQAKAIDPWWRCTVPQCVGPGSVNGRASLGWLWNTDAGTNQVAELSRSSGGSAIIYIILDSFEIKVNRRAFLVRFNPLKTPIPKHALNWVNPHRVAYSSTEIFYAITLRLPMYWYHNGIN